MLPLATANASRLRFIDLDATDALPKAHAHRSASRFMDARPANRVRESTNSGAAGGGMAGASAHGTAPRVGAHGC